MLLATSPPSLLNNLRFGASVTSWQCKRRARSARPFHTRDLIESATRTESLSVKNPDMTRTGGRFPPRPAMASSQCRPQGRPIRLTASPICCWRRRSRSLPGMPGDHRARRHHCFHGRRRDGVRRSSPKAMMRSRSCMIMASGNATMVGCFRSIGSTRHWRRRRTPALQTCDRASEAVAAQRRARPVDIPALVKDRAAVVRFEPHGLQPTPYERLVHRPRLHAQPLAVEDDGDLAGDQSGEMVAANAEVVVAKARAPGRRIPRGFVRSIPGRGLGASRCFH